MTHPGGRWTAGLPAVLPLEAGGRWRRRLPSAAGAGSAWRAEFVGGDRYSAEVLVELEPTAPPTAAPGGPPPAAHGVPEVLVVHALAPGDAVWRLRLARPWARGAPVAEHLLEVRVRQAAAAARDDGGG
ncbi:MAG TPA: hypothetical protein VGM21_15870 [Actinomycetota bacterium]